MSFESWKCSSEAWEYYLQTGKYAHRIQDIIQVMWHASPMNQTQAIHETRALPGNAKMTDHAITPRFAPMLRAGIIRETGKGICSFTGRTTMFYELTYEKPIMTIREASESLGGVRLKDVERQLREAQETIAALHAENTRLRILQGPITIPRQLELI